MGCKDFEVMKDTKVEPKCDIDVDVRLFDSCEKPVHMPPNPKLIKVPRWLKRVNLRGVLIDDVTIPGGFKEIKNIEKKVILTQAKLVCDQLFVEGFIEKNITFITAEIHRMEERKCLGHKNDWHDITVKVPFSFTMQVKDLPHDLFAHDNKDREHDFSFKCDTRKNKCCDEGTTGESLCEKLKVTKVFLNEVPFVDFIGFKITEIDISRRGKMERDDFDMLKKGKCDHEDMFKVLTEKLILNLVFDIYIDGWATSDWPTSPIAGLPMMTCTGEFPIPGAKPSVTVEEIDEDIDVDCDKDFEINFKK